MKTATYQPVVTCFSLWTLSALCVWGPVSDDTWDAPEELVNWHQLVTQKERFSGIEADDSQRDSFASTLDQVCMPSTRCSFFNFPLLENTVTCISQLSAKEGNLSDYWTCHQKLQSAHDVRDPWVIPVTNFLVPNSTVE